MLRFFSWLCKYLNIRLVDYLAYLCSYPLAFLPFTGLSIWQENVMKVADRTTGYRDRVSLVHRWIMNRFLSLKIAHLSPSQIMDMVIVEHASWERLERACDRGLIVVLPHMGSWDLAGAYGACRNMNIVSVAERLPHGFFEFFSALRAKMGMKIYPHDANDLMSKLSDDLARGALVCLLSDRSFSSRGIDVEWSQDFHSLLPAGALRLAQRTSSAIVPLICYWRSPHLVIEIGSLLTVKESKDDLYRAAQDLCDIYRTAIERHCSDWLVMTPLKSRG